VEALEEIEISEGKSNKADNNKANGQPIREVLEEIM